MTDHPFQVPAHLAHTVRGFRGGSGIDWLRELPNVVREVCRAWGLTIGRPYGYASLSYVARVTRAEGEPAVLKVGFLLDEIASEAEALQAYGGRGAVRLLEADAARGAILSERCEPGEALAELRGTDDDACEIAAGVMGEIRTSEPAGQFPTVQGWCEGFCRLRSHFAGRSGPIEERAVDRAEGLARDLIASCGESVLLHGDLHQFNILRSERRPWLAIDPKGVIGDAAFEPAAFFGNLWSETPDPSALMRRRVDLFSERLNLPRERVRGWGIVQSVLSAWWSIEDQGFASDEALARVGVMASIPE